jgi:hypothetical protein
MSFYLTLTAATLTILFLQYLIWKRNRNVFLPLATFVLYVWSLLGGWFIIYDQLNNNGSSKIGVHYYDYFEKLFPVELNNDYLTSIIYLSLFIIAFQVAVFFLTKKSLPVESPREKPVIRHQSVIAISIASVALSFFFIYQQMLEAAQHHESFYIFISHHNGKFYSLYQIFKSCSLITAFGGLVIYLNGEQTNFFNGNKVRFGMTYYLFLMLVVVFYSMLLGSRHDLVFAGVFTLILYVINGKKILYKDLLIIITALVLPVFLIELTRGIPVLDYLGLNIGGAPSEEVKIKLSGRQALSSLLLSNEFFAGHMSMYGVVHWQLPFTHGSSFTSLFASIVPRFIKPTRPQDIYQYYITIARNPGLQGFTINHAAAWYLNFGVPGIVAGGTLLGACVAFASNIFSKLKNTRNHFIYCLQVLALPGIISFMPMFIRTGPEGYKSLLFEAILFPALLFWLPQLKPNSFHTLFKSKK